MPKIASTPKPPYYAVIFTSVRTEGENGYGETVQKMAALAAKQPGYLGMETARDAVGLTVSYWDSLEAIAGWKANAEHEAARKRGHEEWYSAFRVRISKVEREYGT
jgi:heme-degrading monooxygenase HmoA